ncbi:hypothetical protein K1719_035038 [Acacia pycnantha]|nr:hypothetical protein K1719_035038 [Acacia pycnantha]
MKRTLSNKIENLIEITHHPDGNTELPLMSPYSYYHRTNTFSSSIRSLIRTRRPDVKEVVQSTRLEQCTLPASHYGYSPPSIVYETLNHALDLSLPNSTTDALVAISNRADDTSIIQIPRQIPKEELAQIMPMEWISNYESLFHGTQTDVHTTTPPTTQDLGNGVTKTIFSRPSTSGPRPPGRLLMLRPAYTPSRKSPPIAWVDQDAKPCFVSHINGHFLWDVPGRRLSGKLDDDEDDYSPPQPVSSRRSTRRWQPPPPPKKSSKDMSLAELMLETGHHDLVQKYFPNATPSTPPEPYSQPPVFTQPIPCIAMIHAYEHDFPPLERKYDQNTRVPSKPFVTPNTVDAQGNHQASQAEEVLNWQTQNAVCQNTVLTRIDSKIDSLASKTDRLYLQLDQLSEEVKNLYFQYRQQAEKLDAELRAFIDRGYMGSQFKQKELELQAIQQDLKKMELDMAKKKSRAIYEPYPSYPSFSTIPAPLFPSSPTSYPKRHYKKQFKFNYPLLLAYHHQNCHHNLYLTQRTLTVRPRQRPLGLLSAPMIQPPSYSTVTLVPTSQTTSPPPTSSIGILQNSKPFSPLQDSSESQTESSSQDYSNDSSEAEFADISRIAMVRPGDDEGFDESYVEQPDDNPPRQDNNYKPTSGPWFTFDDLPYEKWRSRLHEFSAWIDLQITAQQIPLRQALQEFVSRFTGTLREWFQNMSPYEKLQAVQVESAAVLLGAIHKEFIGDFNLIRKREKQEFFEMKCCSLKRSDLQHHYQRMIQKYHALNGGNDVNLRHTFIVSLPGELLTEI